MAENMFADLIPAKGGSANPFADLIPAKQEESSIPAFLRDVPKEIAAEAKSGAADVAALGRRGEMGAVEGFTSLPKAVLGAARVALSPITGAARSVIGHPVADIETAVGGLIDPDVAKQREQSGAAYEDAKKSVDTAMAAGRPGGVGPGLAPKPRVVVDTPALTEGQEVAVAADRLSNTVSPVEVPRALASDSVAVQRTGQAIRNIPIVGDAIPKSTLRLGDQLEEAAGTVAGQFGGGSGPNVAHRIGETISGQAQVEAQAAKTAAAQSDAAVLAQWERSVRATEEGIAGVEQSALQRARQSLGDMSPQDMGETLIARLRQGEQEARATKERLYGVAGETGGSVHPDALSGLRPSVMRSLDDSGVIIDPVVNGHSLTPAAARMMAELDNIPAGQLRNKAVRARSEVVERPTPENNKTASTSVEPQGERRDSLLEFLAKKGGLGPDAELEAIGGHGHVVGVEGVGRRKLVRQGGLPLDYAREAAEEAGYLRGDHKGTATVSDLLNAIDAEMRGQKRFPEGFEGSLSKRERGALSERERHEKEAFTRGLEDDLKAAGYSQLRPDVRRDVLQSMAEGRDADSAVEHILRGNEQRDNALGSGKALPQAPIDMQTLELTRKRLNALSQAATNDADRRAARSVIRAYDDWLGDAFDNALFMGSDDALKAYRAARAANTEWRQRFGFNARDDADRVVNRIVTGEVTPQEVANYVVGATKVGSKGVSSRLLTRIAEATGGDPEAMNAIRAGVWNRLSQSTEGVNAKTAVKVADDIGEFLNGSGRDVANRLFSEPQRAVARAYAQTLRQAQEARSALADVAANTKPGQMEVGIGPFQQLAKAVLGGGRADEALYSAINSYAKSGSRGDINLLSKVLQAVPQAERGNLASAMVRDMGVSPRTGQFSPDVFVSSWNTYRPEAKALLFGMSGPQRAALDDIAKISLRMKEIGSRFGNPSGTAQNVNYFALAGSAIAAPLTTLAAAIGGAGAAKVLSSPVGASKVAQWSRAYEAAAKAPTPARIEAYNRASSLLAINVGQVNGGRIKEILSSLQSGPVPAGAEEKQR
jgi:hypothetical protein